MQFLTLQFPDFLSLVCKAHQKWGIFVSPSWDWDDPSTEGVNPWTELPKAIPFLNKDEIFRLLAVKSAFLLFDTKQEMIDAYDQIVGDDGPTSANPYSEDRVRVYALTCNPQGITLTENT